MATGPQHFEGAGGVFHDSPRALFCVDSRGRCSAANRRFSELVGRSAQECQGHTLRELAPGLAPHVEPWLRRTLESRERAVGVTIPGALGESESSSAELQLACWPLVDEEGALLGAAVELSEPVPLLPARTAWLRCLDLLPDPMFLVDVDWRLVWANQALAEKLGVSAEELRGQRCTELMHGTESPPAGCPHRAFLEQGGGGVVTAQVEHALGGQYVVSVAPLREPGGELWGSLHLAHDVTARVRAEKQLEEAREESEQRYRVLVEEEAAAALQREAEYRAEERERAVQMARLAGLTPREREVLGLVVAGRLNKQIATQLGITEKTVKVHRGRVMEKTQAGSLAELVRLAEKAGIALPE